MQKPRMSLFQPQAGWGYSGQKFNVNANRDALLLFGGVALLLILLR